MEKKIETKYYNPYNYRDIRAPLMVTAKQAKEISNSSEAEMKEMYLSRLTDRINTLIIEAAERKEYKIAVLLPRDYWYQMVNQYRYWDYDVTIVESDKDAGNVTVTIGWE